MKDRYELFSKFLSFFHEITNQHSVALKILHSDNTLEYNCTAFKQFLDKNDIIHEVSSAHTSPQNGVAHRHLLEVTLNLISHMSVSKPHWREALLTSCYLINHTPSSSVK